MGSNLAKWPWLASGPQSSNLMSPNLTKWPWLVFVSAEHEIGELGAARTRSRRTELGAARAVRARGGQIVKTTSAKSKFGSVDVGEIEVEARSASAW